VAARRLARRREAGAEKACVGDGDAMDRDRSEANQRGTNIARHAAPRADRVRFELPRAGCQSRADRRPKRGGFAVMNGRR